jgi:small subunit ribosomal protein S16
MRLGKIRAPYYRIVVADSRTKREGRVIETIGKYHPKQEPSLIEVDSERARYWLSVGAQPTEPVAAILKLTGDWQHHKGLPAPEHGVKVAAAKEDRKAIFEAAAKETIEADAASAKSSGAAKKAAPAKKAAAKKADAAPADAAVPAPAADGGEDAPVDEPARAEEAAASPAETETPAATETPAEDAPAAADAPAAEASADEASAPDASAAEEAAE